MKASLYHYMTTKQTILLPDVVAVGVEVGRIVCKHVVLPVHGLVLACHWYPVQLKCVRPGHHFNELSHLMKVYI